MCNKVVCIDPWLLKYVPDWFVVLQEIWYKNFDEIIEWYEDYKKQKAQKAQIKKELMPIACHPNLVMDWCMSEDENRWWK